MKAAAYLRCSGETQVKGDTWARQREAIDKYASANGIEVAHEFRDEAVTGKMELENREGLSACIHYVQQNQIRLVIVESSDRLARDLIVEEVCIREFQKAGVRVISASGGIDLTAGDDANPTAKLVRQILSAIAEFDRCVVNLKLRAAKDRKRQNDPDWRDGRKPYGLKDGEEEQLKIMRELRTSGATLQTVADALTARGYVARSGKRWTVGALHRILARVE